MGAKKKKLPTIPKREISRKRAAINERKLIHMTALLGAILFDKAEDPDVGLSYSEHELPDPRDVIVEIVPDPEHPQKTRIVVRARPIPGMTPGAPEEVIEPAPVPA